MSDPQSGRSLRIDAAEFPVFVFTMLYMLVALIAAARLQNREFIFYFVVMVILIAAVAILRHAMGLKIAALWGLSIWGLAHMAGGLMPIPESWPRGGDGNVLYNLWLIPGWLKYDQLVHAYGFGLVTWICWQAVRTAFRSRGLEVAPSFGLLSLCVAAGMGFGAANEVVEFIATLTLPDTNVGGYANTGWDLVANLVGCVLAALCIRITSKTVSDPQSD